MVTLYYNPDFKYTNRKIITISEADDAKSTKINVVHLDTPDTINGHIVYNLGALPSLPTYLVDNDTDRRFFITGYTQLSGVKYQLSLLRDVISENPSLWQQETAYISAGLATDYNKYKRWDLPYTNTKVKEDRLNINGKSSFFVYYVNTQTLNSDAQNNTNVLSEEDLKISYTSIPGITGYDYSVANIAALDNSQLINYAGNDVGAINTVKDVNVSFNWVGDIPYTTLSSGEGYNGPYATGKWFKYKMTYNLEEPAENSFSYSILDSAGKYPSYYVDADNALTGNVLHIPMLLKNLMVYNFQNRDGFFNNYGNSKYAMRDQLKAVMTSYFSSFNPQNQETVSSVDKYVGKIIYNEADKKVYTVDKSTSDYQLGGNLHKNYYTAFVNTIKNISFPYYFIENGNSTINYGANDIKGYGNFISYTANQSIITYTLRELGVATSFNFNFKANTRKLPRSSVRCVNIVSDDTENGISDSDIAQTLMLAQANPTNPATDTGRILDVQFLPFSMATATNENFKINDTPIKAMFLDADDLEFYTDMADLTAINKECDTIKIVSPSRASQYLFRPYNNDGIMEFRTKITLRPYNTIIYVRPSTKGLLMYDYDDKDCLIISEDFSLTAVTSEWTNYIYNNRNYNDVFERQIQGREFERTWERKIEEAQKKSDEWTSRNISAQKASTYTGNLPIISSVAGAIGTAFQDQTYLQMAQIDRQYNEATYQEGIQLSRDLFEMQLENIQSQPIVPSKISTLDAKLLPGVYLEYYSSNPSELQAINDFYKFNGNRIDAYGTFSQYLGWFVRGKIIISQFYTQPELDELNRRLGMGIFTGVEYGNQ